MRPGRLRDIALGIAIGATAVAVLSTPVARADEADANAWAAEYGPAACDLLASRPTISQLAALLYAVNTPEQSGEYVATAVFTICPEHIPLLRQFVQLYGGQAAIA